MKQILRVVLGLILFIVFIAGVAVCAFLVFSPEQKLIRLAQNMAREHLHREIGIRDLGFGLGSARIDGLVLSRKPDFSAGTLLCVERVAVRCAILPLLRRVVHTTLLEITGPDLELYSTGNPARQIALLSAAPLYALRQAAVLNQEFRLDALRIAKGTLRVLPASGNKPLVVVRDFACSAGPFNSNEPCTVSFAATADAGNIPLRIAGKFRAAAAGNSISIEQITVRQASYSLVLSGDITNAADPSQTALRLTLEGDRIVLDTLSVLAPAYPGIQLYEDPRLKLSITGNPRALRIKSIPVR